MQPTFPPPRRGRIDNPTHQTHRSTNAGSTRRSLLDRCALRLQLGATHSALNRAVRLVRRETGWSKAASRDALREGRAIPVLSHDTAEAIGEYAGHKHALARLVGARTRLPTALLPTAESSSGGAA